MTYNPMADVKEFHDKFDKAGKARSMRPISIPLLEKRRKLIREEAGEVLSAIEDYKKWLHWSNLGQVHGQQKIDRISECREHLAKELADLIYLVYGTAEELSIPLKEVFAAVHKSNMGKLWPDGEVHYNEFNKVIKPPSYQPPDLSFIHEWNTLPFQGPS